VSPADVLAAGPVLAAGLPLAYAVTRRLPLALLLTPICSALLASAAVMLMLLVGGSLRVWLAGAIALECAAVAPLLMRRRARTPLPHGGWPDAAWLALPVLPPFLLTLRSPDQWDAHSIWWLHAALFVEGPGTARPALASPVFLFSHTDYPPLASAPVAAVWAVLPRYDFRVAQLVSIALAFSAITMLAYAVRRVTEAAPVLVSRLAAAGVALAAWSTEPSAVGTGMSDPVWSAAFTAGAVLLLLGGAGGRAEPTLPLLLLGTAALTKNEGFVAVAIVAVLVTLRERGRARTVWLPVAAGLAWALLARHLGATSDLRILPARALLHVGCDGGTGGGHVLRGCDRGKRQRDRRRCQERAMACGPMSREGVKACRAAYLSGLRAPARRTGGARQPAGAAFPALAGQAAILR